MIADHESLGLAANISKAIANALPQLRIRLSPELREEAYRQHFAADPPDIIDRIRITAQNSRCAITEPIEEAWWDPESLEAALASVVYGSNMIESAGSTLAITTQLCRAVFRGRTSDISIAIDETDPAYEEDLAHLRATNRPANHQHVVASRREIVQHAQALAYMVNHIVIATKPWSEQLILDIHRILHDGLDDDVEAGTYRTYEVAVKYEKPGQKEKQKLSLCMRARAVPGNTPTEDDPVAICIDPYTLAARYHHQFVNIHPFGDGNGRMSRIILNSLLLRYAGHISEIGLDVEEREEYIGIATRASRVFHSEDMEVEFEEHTGHRELARFILVKSKRGLERMWHWAAGKGEEDGEGSK
ncbi:Filamentation induced by cAMP/death on curing-related protein [Parachaetomium inaequale]|uniref:Filamentation induced by cAMP/death on curing-related protein n=1 Tax=Parachaetomium inaequale TaxID=2588326 RepID=A0AAN6PBL1_9PEZI|nr:Filamentation induced by cAMP/death on curing-related protein [Parachaetomium inaequale]